MPIAAGRFPWVLFTINVAGSALLGATLAEQSRRPGSDVFLHDVVGIGFCGGLTTFSTFAVEVAGFLRADRSGLAAVYVLASVTVGILAALAGAAGLRQVRAFSQPVEEGS